MYVAAPVSAFQRNLDLQFAALIVALVLVPGLVEPVVEEPEPAVTAHRPSRPVRTKSSKGRHVRPPRSC